MDKYLDSFRKMIFLHGLSDRTINCAISQLAADKKYLEAVPGIIQVLHTWGQTLNFHPHIHCIVTGSGLTKDNKLKKSSAAYLLSNLQPF